MRVVLMVGGLGTRLRPFSYTIPKPLFPIKEKPILEIVIEQLRKHGLKDIVLALGYKGDLIKSVFGDGKKFGVKISYVEEKKRLGTAGALSLVKKKIGNKETLLVMNGDILTKLNFKKFIKFHKKNKSDFTIAIKTQTIKVPWGIIKTNKQKEIQTVKEKPKFSMDVSTGIYLLEPSTMKEIPANKYCDFPSLTKKLIKQKKKVLAYKFKEEWKTIETMTDYNNILKNKK